MTDSPETIVQKLLRPSEEAKYALETTKIQQFDARDGEDGVSGFKLDSARSTEPIGPQTRIIAVVTHIDSLTGDEQASLFCINRRAYSASQEQSSYFVEHAFPIHDAFSIAMAQARRSTIDLSASPLSPVSPRTELTLTIHPGIDSSTEPLILLTQDIQRLRPLLAECKRLRDISIANSEPTVKPAYAWILPYISRPHPSILSSIPQDLRHAHRPVEELLADVCAGTSTPASDVFDILKWPEDLIKALGARVGIDRLRIGTFNVNGKLPSQDMAALVQSRPDLLNFIPPLEELSPFNIDDITEDPLATSDGYASTTSTPLRTGDSKESITSSTATLVPGPTNMTDSESPDMLVFGFQELDLSAGALLYSTETTREEAWSKAVMAGLGDKAELYEKLASKQLVGMLLIIIVRRTILECFTQVQTASVGAGIMGLMGNKGGTAIRLTFTPHPTAQVPTPRNVIMTFVNAHLAAFDDACDRRNADFHDLSKRLLFDSGVPAGGYEEQAAQAGMPTVPLNIYQSDALFWLGDLNYRINLSDLDIRTLLAQEQHRSLNFPLLLNYDQLNVSSRTHKAFSHFKEHPITHPPSYRFNTNLSSDDLGYDLKRKPAWTDRVLHMSCYTAHVKQIRYGSHAEITMSDHRPVSADFEIHMPVIDTGVLDVFVHDKWKEVANFENLDVTPQLVVEPSLVDFGKIGYKRHDQKVLQVKNVGKVASTFRFVPVASDADIHPGWLRVEPMTGLLLPAKHVDIVLSVNVNDSAANILNSEDAQLEALLILHTSLGKDHFISVSGQWERTCFGTSVERLVRIPGPVRSLTKPELVPQDQAATAPKEVMRLVSWLMSNASDVNDLFLDPGDGEVVCAIRESLDTGADFPPLSADNRARVCASVAQCLVQLLASLPDTLAPAALHHRCASVASREDAFELLNDFPGPAVNIWLAVTSFLHYICQQDSAQDKSDREERLAAVFTPILFGDSITTTSTAPSPIGKRKFVKAFIG